MKTETSTVTKLRISELESLDPISVFLEDMGKDRGKITIECYGRAWSAFWGGIGNSTMAQFFCSCDAHYLAKKLSTIKANVYDIDRIYEDAGKKGIECPRDDPWNDYDFMSAMYGPGMVDWSDSLPKMVNPDYLYLCRIIRAVQDGIRQTGLRGA